MCDAAGPCGPAVRRVPWSCGQGTDTPRRFGDTINGLIATGPRPRAAVAPGGNIMELVRGRNGLAAVCALLCAFAAMSWQATAAHATYGKVTVVKQNVGGDPADTFGFTPSLIPAKPAFSLLGGGKQTYEIDCNVGQYCHVGTTLSITED